MWLPEEDKYTNRKNELLASLAVSMGGRVAEEIAFGDITNGARGDTSIDERDDHKSICRRKAEQPALLRLVQAGTAVLPAHPCGIEIDNIQYGLFADVVFFIGFAEMPRKMACAAV